MTGDRGGIEFCQIMTDDSRGGGGFWQIMTHDRGVKKISARLRAENFLPLLCVVIKCGEKKAVILRLIA